MSIPIPFPNINDTDTNDVQTWSSSKILDYLTPALESEATKTTEETGTEVTFNNVDPDTCTITKAVIEILPSQQGSGDPSPHNPRAINTFDTVYLTQHNADNTKSTTYDISLGSTVYGLTGDCVSGEFEETWKAVTFNGSASENWYKYNTGSASAFAMAIAINDLPFARMTDENDIKTNYLKSLKSTETWGNFDNWVSKPTNARTLITGIQSITTVEDWKQYLSEHPLTVCYRVETPTELTTDPITSDLYEGTNVLGCAPAGTVDIEITCTDTIGNILMKEGIL